MLLNPDRRVRYYRKHMSLLCVKQEVSCGFLLMKNVLKHDREKEVGCGFNSVTVGKMYASITSSKQS